MLFRSQGNLSQNRRQAAMDGFRNGTYQILVATDIAARGIDVSQVSHVINYDIPDTSEAYIHRIGRTGRAARNGDAFTMITDEDTVMVKAIERTLGTAIERRTVDGFDYTVPAPRKDDEFARPPRPPRNQPKSKKPAPKPAAGQGAAPARPEHKPAGAKPAPAGGARHPQRSHRPR